MIVRVQKRGEYGQSVVCRCGFTISLDFVVLCSSYFVGRAKSRGKSSFAASKPSGQVTDIISSVKEPERQRCRFCNIMFSSLLELEYHYSDTQHRVSVIRHTQKSQSATNFRPPPDGVYMGRYKVCRRSEIYLLPK